MSVMICVEVVVLEHMIQLIRSELSIEVDVISSLINQSIHIYFIPPFHNRHNRNTHPLKAPYLSSPTCSGFESMRSTHIYAPPILFYLSMASWGTL